MLLLPGVCELVSVHVLSFMANQCCVLVNNEWILQLQWEQASQEPKTISCCRIQLTTSDRHTAVHHCVCAETLFVLSSSGLICILQKASYIDSKNADFQFKSELQKLCLLIIKQQPQASMT